ncbi:MAG: hypothetical protein ABWW66_04425 [Archaeoglobaceae archaeon]
MLKLSYLTSYLTCPRLCYYRISGGEEVYTEKQAVRDIYISLRMGFDENWARKRAEARGGFREDVFNSALSKFKMSDEVRALKPSDWEVVVVCEKLDLTLTIDEIADDKPLFVSLKAPKEGVWFADAVRVAAASLCSGSGSGFVYYAYDAQLRRCEVTFPLRRSLVKLVERVKRVEKGFLPEKRVSRYCEVCAYAELCNSQPETFASKFL